MKKIITLTSAIVVNCCCFGMNETENNVYNTSNRQNPCTTIKTNALDSILKLLPQEPIIILPSLLKEIVDNSNTAKKISKIAVNICLGTSLHSDTTSTQMAVFKKEYPDLVNYIPSAFIAYENSSDDKGENSSLITISSDSKYESNETNKITKKTAEALPSKIGKPFAYAKEKLFGFFKKRHKEDATSSDDKGENSSLITISSDSKYESNETNKITKKTAEALPSKIGKSFAYAKKKLFGLFKKRHKKNATLNKITKETAEGIEMVTFPAEEKLSLTKKVPTKIDDVVKQQLNEAKKNGKLISEYANMLTKKLKQPMSDTSRIFAETVIMHLVNEGSIIQFYAIVLAWKKDPKQLKSLTDLTLLEHSKILFGNVFRKGLSSKSQKGQSSLTGKNFSEEDLENFLKFCRNDLLTTSAS